MIELYIEEEPIHIAPDTSIALEYNSPLFLGEDVDVVQGTVVFSITALDTLHNAYQLKHIADHDTRIPRRNYTAAQLRLRNTAIVEGVASVTQIANGYTIKLYAGVGALSELKETFIDEIPPFTQRVYADGRTQIDQGIYGVDDFFVFPFWDSDAAAYRNEWDFENDLFKDPNTPIVPFMAVDYVLEHVLAWVGYTAQSRLLQGEAMEGLVLLSNTQINDTSVSDIPDWQPHQALPRVTGTTFLKQLAKALGLAIVPDNLRRRIKLIRYADLLADTNAEDWTDKLLMPITQEWIDSPAIATEEHYTDTIERDVVLITPPDLLLDVATIDFPVTLRGKNDADGKLETCVFAFAQGLQTASGSTTSKDYPASGTSNAEGTVNLAADHWSAWVAALNAGRQWSASVALTFNDLETLDLSRKIAILDSRTGNRATGFIKTLKTTITQRGIESSTVELILLPS